LSFSPRATIFAAVRDGDMAGLVALLKANIVFHADGGGKSELDALGRPD
jgi:hypothetical protein